MKVGDLVDFEFEDVYTGLILATATELLPYVQVLFFDKGVVTYTMEELDECSWEVISESR